MLCYLYGTTAVFQKGLHIVKRKPNTVLSNGIVWSDAISTLHFVLSVVLWLGSTILTLYLLRWFILARARRKSPQPFVSES